MNKDKNPQHDEIQKKNELQQHEVVQVLNFLKRYGKLIGTGVLVAAIVVLASRGMAARKAARIAEAEQMLMTAQTPEALQEIVDTYKSTPTAPVALLDLAKTLFNQGNYAEARVQYELFAKEYKKSDLMPMAQFGLAHCTEADGNFAAAAEEFKDFLADHPESYLSSPAVLSLARCQEQAGNLDEARITLEDFLSENNGSQWTGVAENALQLLNQ